MISRLSDCCSLYSRIFKTRWNWRKSVPTRLWHQPAATLVNTTRCCKHSQVLLMMG